MVDPISALGTAPMSTAIATPDTTNLHQSIAGVMQLAKLAAALLDTSTGRIIWCTTEWSEALPSLNQGASWSEARQASSELEALAQAFEDREQLSGNCFCEGVQLTKCLSLHRQDAGIVALLLQEPKSLADQMHHYMQARESMFTTSRTISVSEMATTLAHEIKQPVATITNILKGVRLRLNKSPEPEESVLNALDKALEQAEFTNSVINRIRDFTQARRPKQKVLDVAVLLQESLSLMDWFLSANQCQVKVNMADESMLCDGDPTMLQQVIVNLLRNGVEAMFERDPENRLLIVSCEPRKKAIRISIRDFGHGLMGKEKTLFVPFTTSKANGMGVGLNICRSFVELHQGRLWLSPNTEEGGCTSHIELPISTSAETETSIDTHSDQPVDSSAV